MYLGTSFLTLPLGRVGSVLIDTRDLTHDIDHWLGVSYWPEMSAGRDSQLSHHGPPLCPTLLVTQTIDTLECGVK